MQNYLLKDVNGNLSLVKSDILPLATLPFPVEHEVIGLAEIFNPNGYDLSISSLEEVETEASYQEIDKPEIEAQDEVLAQDEVSYTPASPFQPEKWIKEGEEDLLIDPADVSWTHVAEIAAVLEVLPQPAIPYQAAIPYTEATYVTIPAVRGMRVVVNSAKNLLARQATASSNLNQIRQLRVPLLSSVDNDIKKAEDDGVDTTSLRVYRKALRDCTNSLKKTNGEAKLMVESIVPSEFEFPTR